MTAKDRIQDVLRRGVAYAEVSYTLAMAGDFNGSDEAARKALENLREAVGLRADIVDGKMKLDTRV